MGSQVRGIDLAGDRGDEPRIDVRIGELDGVPFLARICHSANDRLR
jgi:hypothetical protein